MTGIGVVHRLVLLLAGAVAVVTAASARPAFARDWELPLHLTESMDAIGSTNADLQVEPDGTVLVAWSEGGTILLGRFSRIFEPLGDPIPLVSGGRPRFCLDSNGRLHFIYRYPSGQSAYLLADRDGTVLRPAVLFSIGLTTWERADLAFGEDGFVHMTNCYFNSAHLFYCRADLDGNLAPLVDVPLPEGPHTILSPRVVPLGDGTVRIFYIDFFDNPSYFSRVYMLRLAASGEVIEGPTCVSHEASRTYGELAVARDPGGDVHVVFHETAADVPIDRRVGRLHYRRFGPDGMARTPIVTLTEEPPHPQHGGVTLALDDRERLHLSTCRERSEIYRDPRREANTDRTIVDYLLDATNPAIADMRIVAATPSWTWPVLRPDGRGGWVGMWGVGHDLWMIRTNRESECRNGAVGGATAFDRRTLSIAGSGGDASHVLRVPGGVDLPLAIEGDALTPTTRFYVQARGGASGPGSPRWFPGAGLACFDFLDYPSAAAIWNGLGHAYGILGRSRVRGTPIPDPVPHPGVFFVIPGVATSGLPPGTRVAFQGFQTDTHAPSGASVTNAIVLEIQ